MSCRQRIAMVRIIVIVISCQVSRTLESAPLHGIGDETAWRSRLLRDLDSDDVGVRRNAASALGRSDIDGTKLLSPLINALGDENRQVRRSVIIALRIHGVGNSSVIRALRALCRDAEAYTAAEAIHALDKVDMDPTQSIDVFIAAARRDHKRLTPVAIRALGDIGATAVPALVSLIGDDGMYVREEALRTLLQLGNAARPAIPELVRAAIRPDRMNMYSICEKLALWSDVAVAELVDALKTTTGFERATVAECLRLMGPDAASALPTILEMAFSTEAPCGACIRLIPAFGPVDQNVLDKLMEMVRSDSNDSARAAAISALGDIKPKAIDAVPWLMEFARSRKSQDMRAEVLRTLRRIRPPADVLVPFCSEILTGESPQHVKTVAVQTLGSYGPEAAVSWPLIQPLLDGETSLRDEAFRAMLAMDLEAEAVMPELIKAVRTGPRFIREWAIKALGELGAVAKKSVPDLLNVARTDELNNRSAAYALGLILNDSHETPSEVMGDLRRWFDEGRRKQREQLRAESAGNELSRKQPGKKRTTENRPKDVRTANDLVGEVMIGNVGVANARVSLSVRPNGGGKASKVLRVATTDDLGTFRFSDVTAGNYQLVIVHAEYEPLVRPVSIQGPRKRRLRFGVESSNPTRFIVLGDNQEPLSDARVRLDAYRSTPMSPVELRTEQDGSFTFTVGRGFVSGTVSCDGYMETRAMLSQQAGRDRIQLKRPYRISGTVTDANTARPIPGFTVSRVVGSSEMRAALKTEGQVLGEFTNGSYEVSFSETSDLPPPFDSLALTFTSPGYLTSVSTAYKDGEGDRVFHIELVPEGQMTGQVLDSDGNPLPDSVVFLATPGTGRPVLQNGHINQRFKPLTSFTADSEGRFSMPSQSDAFMLLVAEDPGFAFVTEKEFDESSTIQLVEWARLSGSLRSGRELVPSGNVMLTVGSTTYSPRSSKHALRPRFYYNLTTDNNGEFVAERVRPGIVHVGIAIEVRSNGSVIRPVQQLNLQPGESLEIAVGGGGIRVTGRVRFPTESGAATARGAVHCESFFGGLVFDRTRPGLPESRTVKLSNVPKPFFPFGFHEDGFFAIEDMPDGKYRLVLNLNCGDSALIGEPNFLVEHDFDVNAQREPEFMDLGDLVPHSLSGDD